MRLTSRKVDSGPPSPRQDQPARTAEPLPAADERLLPWLGAAVVVAVIVLGALMVGADALDSVEITTLLGGLCATLATAGLVATRSARSVEAQAREERARPAREQLEGPVAAAPLRGHGARTYLDGMERWMVALLELTSHACEASDDDRTRQELTAAAADTEALQALLRAGSERDLDLGEVATLQSICAMWETSQERVEGLAASIDPRWHRRWSARSVVERRLRRGPLPETEVELPYRI